MSFDVFQFKNVCACVRDRREGKVAMLMGKARKRCLSRRVRRCARFAWQAWQHFVTLDVFQHDRRETKVGVLVGKATKTCLSQRVRRCVHVVLHGRRGTL